MFPKEWADIIVQKFCSSSDSVEAIKNSLEDWLKPLQEEWIKNYLISSKYSELPWWAKGSASKNHASATFIGLKLKQLNSGKEKIWEAVAIGDSCLFRISSDLNKLESFPIKNYQEFTTVTDCFHSSPEYKYSELKYKEGIYEEDDVFLLATDALSQWILSDSVQSSRDWEKLINLSSQEEFASFVENVRSSNLIRNDDTSLAIIKIPKGNPKSTKSQIPLPQPITTQTPAPISTDSAIDRDTGLPASNSLQEQMQIDRDYYQYKNRRLLKFLWLSGAIHIIMLGSVYFLLSNRDNGKNISGDKLSVVAVPTKSGISGTTGFLLVKLEQQSSQVWVLIPQAYTSKMTEKHLIIPAGEKPLPMFVGDVPPTQSLLENSIGYLLPGTYSYLEDINLTESKEVWVKIKVR